jgi:DNA-binding NarL/FixJ family response regulator
MPSRRPVRILTVDDQAPFREATKRMVAGTPGFELAGESADGASALRMARELDPDLVLMDVRMNGMDGIETTRRLTAEDPTRVVLLVSGDDLSALSEEVRGSGAAAVLRKHWLSPRMLRGLWVALRKR